MNKQEINRYFRILSTLYRKPCTIILIGAGAGALYGRVRATMDLDFALKFKTHSQRGEEKLWQEFSEQARETSARTGIAAHYAEDIDRWSSITYLDYDKHTLRFRRFGSLNLRLLEPSYWAIGKLTRYLDPDIRDVIEVMRRTKIRPGKLSRVLGLALKKSPRSTACDLFRRQVEDFLAIYGRRIWGRDYLPDAAIRTFHRYAGFKPRLK